MEEEGEAVTHLHLYSNSDIRHSTGLIFARSSQTRAAQETVHRVSLFVCYEDSVNKTHFDAHAASAIRVML